MSLGQSRLFRILEFVFGAFLFVSLLISSKTIEENIFPVVNSFNVTDIKELENGIEIRGLMNKSRSCDFKNLTAYVETNSTTARAVSVDYTYEESSPLSRAAIHQSWGPWVIFIPETYDYAKIDLFTIHSCHAFYNTHSNLYSFSISRDENSEIYITEQGKP